MKGLLEKVSGDIFWGNELFSYFSSKDTESSNKICYGQIQLLKVFF